VKITMVSEHASPLAALGEADAGGQNVHVAALARGLAQLGHDVAVYTRREDPDVPERVDLCPGAEVVHVPVGPGHPVPKDDLLPLMDAFADWMGRDWSRHGVPDVVHAHFWMSGLAALRAARAHGIPVAQTFHALGTVKRRHQGAADTSPAERLALERRIASEVDVIVATCHDEVRELALMGVPAEQVRVVPCGVDTTHFTPVGRALTSRGRRLLTVGRMVERKGFDTAVQALLDLPGAELVIAGGPPAERLAADPEARRLGRLAQGLGVADRVTMLGQVAHSAMPEVYRSADVVLAVPWYEPFGITPLEAAACGRPLVGSAVGGLLDTVEDGATGILVPPRDPTALAAAARRLLDHPEMASRWGYAARVRAVAHYDWSTVAQQTEEVLLGLCRPAAKATCATRTWLESHAEEVREGMASLLDQASLVRSWGERLATSLVGGARLLAAGNGGSAAEAQHLTAELVGRYCGERRPLSGIALTAETSSLTAILNDYGPDEVFARQVEAHGREGDILVLLSTSGSSSNVLHAAKRAHELGLQVWSMTGPAPNPLASLSDEALTITAGSTAAVQEVQLMAVHALCAALDATLSARGALVARGWRE
jgi:type III pantothenate kinase